MKLVLGFVSLLFLSCRGIELDGPLDLSWPYDDTARQCPGSQDFKFLKKIRNEEGIWNSLNTFAVSEHCGTHIDAPYHFDKEGDTLGKISLDKFLVTAILVDVSEDTGDNVNYTMPLSKITEWEEVNGPIPDKSVVLIKFGWASRYLDKDKYLGVISEEGKGYRHPGLTPEASQYLINIKKIVGVGLDGPSIDPGYDYEYKSHVLFAKAGLYILENVAIISPLPTVFKLIVAPMKIAEGTGGPVRLIALPKNYNF